MIVFSQENSKSNRMLTSIVDKVDIKQNIQNIQGELLSNDTPFKILQSLATTSKVSIY